MIVKKDTPPFDSIVIKWPNANLSF
uniref:Uncharacterized protein n=1 Tax=Arundo donax TaxID=35708 RepID=A0A0A9BUA0_ARUDO